jgi:RNA polymerase sigma factor (sigma-70 family)
MPSNHPAPTHHVAQRRSHRANVRTSPNRLAAEAINARPGTPARLSPRRADDLAALYRAQHRNLERIVARQVRAPGTIAQDACQTAWARLCAHPDLALEEHAALSWLITTATREAWKQSRRLTTRQATVAFQIDSELDALAEPAAEDTDPSELAIANAEHQQRVTRLRALSDRERLYLYLQGLGYSYSEMANLTSASIRTVERQVLRARSKLGNPRPKG